jgi:NADH-quinone oxidoreductase subunit M
MSLITILILLPLVGALLTLLVPPGNRVGARSIGVLIALVAFGFNIAALAKLDRSSGAPQLGDRVSWIRNIAIEWNVGVTGISVWMMLLTTGLFLLAFIAVGARMPDAHPRALIGLLLLAECGLLGVFAAGDLVLFYVFWEAMLIPFALLIWMWGDRNRGRAAAAFVIYTMVGSLLMLVAILSAAFIAKGPNGTLSFAMTDLANHEWTRSQSTWLFAAFALAFLIKLPLFPFHGWMAGAYTSAPLVVTALLSAVMSKAGAYGLLRIAVPIFPVGAERLATTISILAVCSIIYGSLMAWRALTMRMLVAYSSLAHLGFIVLGIMSFTSIGAEGSVLQMFNHGVVIAAAFAIVGIIARAKHGTEEMDQITGLAKGAPVLAVVFLVITMAALAIPGSNAFAGEFFILIGTFQPHPVLAVLATFGTAYAAVYMLRLYQTTMNGPLEGDPKKAELRGIDALYLAPLVAAMVVVGLWPGGITRTTKAAVECATTSAGSIGLVSSAGQPPRTEPISTELLGCR